MSPFRPGFHGGSSQNGGGFPSTGGRSVEGSGSRGVRVSMRAAILWSVPYQPISLLCAVALLVLFSMAIAIYCGGLVSTSGPLWQRTTHDRFNGHRCRQSAEPAIMYRAGSTVVRELVRGQLVD